MSHLVNVPVFCFLFACIQRRQRLAPNNVDRILPESEPGEMAIYMHQPRDHFDVVMPAAFLNTLGRALSIFVRIL